MIDGPTGRIDETMREEITNTVDKIDRCLCWDRHKILQQYRKLKRMFPTQIQGIISINNSLSYFLGNMWSLSMFNITCFYLI